MNLRWAAYTRYSTDKQNPLSNEDQTRKCDDYASPRNWKRLEEYTYADEEITGATLERPGLKRLLADAASPTRPFDVLLVEDTSRLSRKQADVLNLCERLKFLGVRVCFVSQGIDSADERFQLLLSLRGLIDQMFLEDTAKRVHRGMESLALKGLHTGGRCYGYRRRLDSSSVRLEIEESQAAVVGRICEMYANGMSLKQIAKTLNAEGIPSPQPQLGRIQRSWSPTAIRQILLNKRYIGRTVWNKKHKVRNPETGRRVYRPRPESDWIVKETPELRIVSDELWQRVQDRFAFVRSHYGSKSRPGLLTHWSAVGSRYLFSGILRCQNCGANMNIISGKGKRGYAKYGCPMHHLRNTCSNDLTERSEVLEKALLQGLQETVLQPELVEYAIEKVQSELLTRLASMNSGLENLRNRKRVLESEIKRLTEALATGASSQHPSAVLAAISEREEELRVIGDQLISERPVSIQVRFQEIRETVTARLSDIQSLLYSDVTKAKAELLRHVHRIDLKPIETDGTRFFEASGEWDLIGDNPSTKSVGAAGRS